MIASLESNIKLRADEIIYAEYQSHHREHKRQIAEHQSRTRRISRSLPWCTESEEVIDPFEETLIESNIEELRKRRVGRQVARDTAPAAAPTGAAASAAATMAERDAERQTGSLAEPGDAAPNPYEGDALNRTIGPFGAPPRRRHTTRPPSTLRDPSAAKPKKGAFGGSSSDCASSSAGSEDG